MEVDYANAKFCELCKVPFSVTRKPHKCKRCKLIICLDCGVNKSIIIGYDVEPNAPHKICTNCSKDAEFQRNFRQDNNPTWGVTCRVGLEFCAASNCIFATSNSETQDYSYYLQQSYELNDLSLTMQQLRRDLKDGRADRETFNYSMLEFLHYAQIGVEKYEIRQNVENVLRAFYAKYSLEHCNIIIPVAVFLLALMNESYSFYTLCFLHESVLPNDFWNRNSEPLSYKGLATQKQIMLKLVERKIGPLSPETKKKFNLMYKKTIDLLIGGLLIGSLNFNSIIFVFEQMMLHRSFHPIEQAIVTTYCKSLEYIETSTEFNIRYFQMNLCRFLFQEDFEAENQRINPQDKIRDEREIAQSGLQILLDNITMAETTVSTFKSLSTEKFKAIVLEIIRLSTEVKNRLKLRTNPDSIDITKKTFINILKEKGGLSNTDEKDLEQIFVTLDRYEKGVVQSKLWVGLMVILLVGGGLENKFKEFVSIKDVGGKDQLDENMIIDLMDVFEEVLAIKNEIDPDPLFYLQIYEMKERVNRECKTKKIMTSKQLFTVLQNAPLLDLLEDQRRRLSLTGRSSFIANSYKQLGLFQGRGSVINIENNIQESQNEEESSDSDSDSNSEPEAETDYNSGKISETILEEKESGSYQSSTADSTTNLKNKTEDLPEGTSSGPVNQLEEKKEDNSLETPVEKSNQILEYDTSDEEKEEIEKLEYQTNQIQEKISPKVGESKEVQVNFDINKKIKPDFMDQECQTDPIEITKPESISKIVQNKPLKLFAEISTQTNNEPSDVLKIPPNNKEQRKESSNQDLDSTFDGGIDKIEDPVQSTMDPTIKKSKNISQNLGVEMSENPENCKTCSIF